jgi:hypothetical protein
MFTTRTRSGIRKAWTWPSSFSNFKISIVVNLSRVYDQDLFEEMYKILASLNVASTIPLDYLRAVQLLSELELTINYVVELVLDELEIKSTFPFASAAKDHVQRLREGKLLDNGTLSGQAENVAHRLLGMNPGIGAGSIECFVSIFDQSWTMTSLKMVSDFYNYPFDVQAGISPNLYLLFDRAAIIKTSCLKNILRSKMRVF